MKRRFVLIDPSIKSIGGHHYEYAERVLRAAKERGMDVILLAHKECDASLVRACDIRPAFTRTFWDNYQFYYAMPGVVKGWGGIQKLKSLLPRWCSVSWLRERLKYSRLGLSIARARDISLVQVLARPCLMETVSAVPASRLSLAAAWIGVRGCRVFCACVHLIVRLFEWCGAKRLIKHTTTGVAYVVGCIAVAPWLLRRSRTPVDVFVNECRVALRDIGWNKQDIIFVPNATPAEMGGYATLARTSASIGAAEWAFLFRRPIFDGYPSSHAQQSEAARIHRLFFASLQKQVPDARVSFYTDTEELTQQYNWLGQYAFRTVPVPVDWTDSPSSQRISHTTLTIGYLGDARDEKGFGLLPKLIEDCRLKRGSVRPIRFLIQSNFNTPRGEPESRTAKALLRQYPPSLVELVEGPLSSEKYAEVLGRIDIMLVPYKAMSYIARSSGVLAESIAAGIPALVPAATWMASIGSKLRHEWLCSQLENTPSASQLLDAVQGDYNKLANMQIRWGRACTHMSIRLTYDSKEDFFVRVVIALSDEFGMPLRVVRECVKTTKGVALVPCALANAASLSFVAGPIDEQYAAGKCQVHLESMAVADDVPLNTSVITYDHDKDLGAKLWDVVSRYSVYKRLAVEARERLLHVYSPLHLVDILSGTCAEQPDCCRAGLIQESRVSV